MSTRRFTPLRFALLVLWLGAVHAHAAPTADERVAASARAWLRDYAARQPVDVTGVEVTVLPPAARYAAQPIRCDNPEIRPVDTRRIARMRFSARCDRADRPVVFVVRGKILAKLLVAATPVPAGRPLTRKDVALAERDWLATPDALADPRAIDGRVSRRALKSGQVLQERFLKAQATVKRGQTVRIVAQTGQIEVSATGTALEDGAAGNTIRVRNTSTGRIVDARVVDGGVVAPVGAASK
ncbi:flagellar basal body P-ring formation protein FlgA [Burkholderia dolosa]|uniref:flagellar basal body P-ring formation chaperone FlgA n=1 Tax=Burkholderia dolosa TaxID=152500 RepID=UPI001B8FB0FA|nr:flagellar basal body P-ring formation chaperone FlgA [Burkholderia dolosa]MBR8313184.1 flagellar basal body P-ring formation protein FlgA [Burkholderia dolosa]